MCLRSFKITSSTALSGIRPSLPALKPHISFFHPTIYVENSNHMPLPPRELLCPQPHSVSKDFPLGKYLSQF